MNHRPDDVLVLPYDDPQVRSLARKHRGRTLFVSTEQAVDRGAWLADGQVYLNTEGGVEDLGSTGDAPPPFPENFLSALVTARLWGISAEQLAQLVPQLLGGEPDR
jgi:UDP-N-acetylmuramoylalanine-D-glutamate ligase